MFNIITESIERLTKIVMYRWNFLPFLNQCETPVPPLAEFPYCSSISCHLTCIVLVDTKFDPRLASDIIL